MKQRIAIIGGGSCAVALCCLLPAEKFDVTVYERNKTPGRKFLVAGDGGLNITHSEEPGEFIERYTPPGFLSKAFSQFNNHDLVQWLGHCGIPTYRGSSGRVFPDRSLRPAQVLSTLVSRARSNGAVIKCGYQWLSFRDGCNIFEHDGNKVEVHSEITVFCMGGASWPVTGSAGEWADEFGKMGIKTRPFEASNCRFIAEWPETFKASFAGKALKNISVSCGGQSVEGEVVVTADGLEGSGIYPLSPGLRLAFGQHGKARILIDLKPSVAIEVIKQRLSTGSAKSITDRLRTNLNLGPVHIALLKSHSDRETFRDPHKLASMIKAVPVYIIAAGAIEDAISTVGGIDLEEIDADFQLKKMPGTFAIGEMLDYDAPTGGYLLQSCFSMAAAVARFLTTGR